MGASGSRLHAGTIGRSGRSIAERRLVTNSIVGLGHRRLSIIDLSPASDEPLFNADGSLAIVFNGEIYNYRELRADLLNRGYPFK